jgi:hypothetical protein
MIVAARLERDELQRSTVRPILPPGKKRRYVLRNSIRKMRFALFEKGSHAFPDVGAASARENPPTLDLVGLYRMVCPEHAPKHLASKHKGNARPCGRI